MMGAGMGFLFIDIFILGWYIAMCPKNKIKDMEDVIKRKKDSDYGCGQ